LNNYNIFRQLFLYYGAIFLFVLSSLFGITYLELSSHLQNSAEEKVRILITEKRKNLNNKLTQTQLNLKSWANLAVMDDLLTDDADLRITRTLETFKTQYNLPGHLYAMSTNATLLASDHELNNNHHLAVWRSAIQKEQYIIDKHIDPITHQYVIAFWQPVFASFDKTLKLGYLIITYPWHAIETLLEQDESSTHFLIFNKAGDTLYKDNALTSISKLDDLTLHKHKPRWSIGILSKLVSKSLNYSHINYIATIDDTDYLISHFNNEKTSSLIDSWQWVALTDANDIFSPIHRLSVLAFIVAAITLLLTFTAIFLISKKISQPIQYLTRSVVDISSTLDLSKRVRVSGNNEFSSLAIAFNELCVQIEKSWQAKKMASDELKTMNLQLEQKVAERTEHLAWQATHDPLTTLPNRTLLSEKLSQGISTVQRNGQMLAVMFIDLDGFKAVNDNFGHDKGDQLLKELSQRFISMIRSPDTVARLGGDEFVILMQIKDIDDLSAPLERIIKLINQPFIINNKTLSVSSSIGVTIFPDDSSDTDGLLRHADQAMYEAKQKGRNQTQFFNIEINTKISSDLIQRKEIEYALEHDQFVLFYQPQINLHTGVIMGAEALIRWNHPEKGLVQPDDFLPNIENTELIIKLGRWVIKQACQQLKIWNAQSFNLKVSVNIAVHHIQHPGFFEEIVEYLAQCPEVSPEQLMLEITESAAIKDFEIANSILQKCNDYKIKSALDDFGTGYSSLTYLRRLPVSFIKIDKNFVIDMLDDSSIVQGTIELARIFNKGIIAEGIETRTHYEELAAMGCTYGQGYGISPPLPAADFSQWLTQRNDDKHVTDESLKRSGDL